VLEAKRRELLDGVIRELCQDLRLSPAALLEQLQAPSAMWPRILRADIRERFARACQNRR
jgi:hypothetical protein